MMTWRDTAVEFVEIGQSLRTIEIMVRSVGATAVVDDRSAFHAVSEAYSAALKMTKQLDSLRRALADEDPALAEGGKSAS